MKKLEMNEETRNAASELISELNRYDNASSVYKNAKKIENEAEKNSSASFYFANPAELRKASAENSEAFKKWKNAQHDLDRAYQTAKKTEFILTCEKCNVEYMAHALNVAMLKAIISTYPKKVPGAATCDTISEEMTKLLNAAGFNVKMRIYRHHRYCTDELDIYCEPAEYGQSYGHTTIDNDGTENTFSAYTKNMYNEGSDEYYENPEESYNEAVKAASEYNAAIAKANALYHEFEKLVPSRYTEKRYGGELANFRTQTNE